MKSSSIFRAEQLKSDRQLLPLAASCLGGAADPPTCLGRMETASSHKKQNIQTRKNLTHASLIIR